MKSRQLEMFRLPKPAAKSPPVRGYASRPGTGPKGQRCNTCRHCMVVVRNDVRTRKCEIRAATWTNDSSTDVKHNAPACRDWAAKPRAEKLTFAI